MIEHYKPVILDINDPRNIIDTIQIKQNSITQPANLNTDELNDI